MVIFSKNATEEEFIDEIFGYIDSQIDSSYERQKMEDSSLSKSQVHSMYYSSLQSKLLADPNFAK